MLRSRAATVCTSTSSSPDRTTRSISSSRPRAIEGEGSERLVGVEFGRLDPITRTALLRYVTKNPPVREEALPAASAFPRIATMPVPRPVLRFASVLTVIVVTTALFVGTAVAAPTSEGFLTGTVSGPSGPIANICVSAQSDN